MYTRVSGIDTIMNLITKPCLSTINGVYLAKLWNIELAATIRTLKVTTHNTRRFHQGTLYRRFRTRIHQRIYNQLVGYDLFFKSTLKIVEKKRVNLL